MSNRNLSRLKTLTNPFENNENELKHNYKCFTLNKVKRNFNKNIDPKPSLKEYSSNISYFFQDYLDVEDDCYDNYKPTRPLTSIMNNPNFDLSKLRRPTSAFENLTSQHSLLFSYK